MLIRTLLSCILMAISACLLAFDDNKSTDHSAGNANSEVKAFVNISPDKMNVLYVGLENNLSLISNLKYDSITVLCDNCEKDMYHVRRSFSIIPNKIGMLNLRVLYNNIEFGPFQYRVKKVPLPQPYVAIANGGYVSNTCSVEKFSKAQGLTMVLNDFDFIAGYRAESFTVVRMKKNGLVDQVINNGPAFNSDSKKLLESIEPGDVFIFSEIRVKLIGADNVFSVDDLSIIIK